MPPVGPCPSLAGQKPAEDFPVLPHHPLLAGALLLPTQISAVLNLDSLQVRIHDHFLLPHRHASQINDVAARCSFTRLLHKMCMTWNFDLLSDRSLSRLKAVLIRSSKQEFQKLDMMSWLLPKVSSSYCSMVGRTWGEVMELWEGYSQNPKVRQSTAKFWKIYANYVSKLSLRHHIQSILLLHHDCMLKKRCWFSHQGKGF